MSRTTRLPLVTTAHEERERNPTRSLLFLLFDLVCISQYDSLIARSLDLVSLFDCDTLCQVSGEVDVNASQDRDVVTKQLHRNDCQETL